VKYLGFFQVRLFVYDYRPWFIILNNYLVLFCFVNFLNKSRLFSIAAFAGKDFPEEILHILPGAPGRPGVVGNA
jgi:hypothetical protein